MKEEKIILALDVPSSSQAINLVEQTIDLISVYKVGLELFLSGGPSVLEQITEHGGEIFLDLKLHDIPHQVGQACRQIAYWQVKMITFHALGGVEMLTEAKRSLEDEVAKAGLPKPLMLGVTVLTSIDEAFFKNIGWDAPLDQLALSLAETTLKAGLDGIVASPTETSMLRQALGKDFLLVTPGIRLKATLDDQKRVATPQQALMAGSNYLVIGRPLLEAENPRQALMNLIKLIK